jgi:hypothetical protein
MDGILTEDDYGDINRAKYAFFEQSVLVLEVEMEKTSNI